MTKSITISRNLRLRDEPADGIDFVVGIMGAELFVELLDPRQRTQRRVERAARDERERHRADDRRHLPRLRRRDEREEHRCRREERRENHRDDRH